MVVEGEKAPRREAGIILNIAHCQITLIDFFYARIDLFQ